MTVRRSVCSKIPAAREFTSPYVQKLPPAFLVPKSLKKNDRGTCGEAPHNKRGFSRRAARNADSRGTAATTAHSRGATATKVNSRGGGPGSADQKKSLEAFITIRRDTLGLIEEPREALASPDMTLRLFKIPHVREFPSAIQKVTQDFLAPESLKMNDRGRIRPSTPPDPHGAHPSLLRGCSFPISDEPVSHWGRSVAKHLVTSRRSTSNPSKFVEVATSVYCRLSGEAIGFDLTKASRRLPLFVRVEVPLERPRLFEIASTKAREHRQPPLIPAQFVNRRRLDRT